MIDRAEITDLLVRYTRVVDERRWDRYPDLFTADAVVDYSAFGGVCGGVEQARVFLSESLAAFSVTQHMLGLPAIEVCGDRARAVVPCHNPMVLGEGTGAQTMVCSLWYHQELVRTQDGWRIASLREEKGFMTFLSGRDTEPAGREKGPH